MTFTDVMYELVTALRVEIETILKNNTFAEGTNKEDYLKIQSELFEMEKSDQLFVIQNRDRKDIGATLYNYEQDAVVFVFPKDDQSLALCAHEFTHGFQFLNSTIALSIYDAESDDYVQPRAVGIWNDIDNERQAYKRGYMFGGDSFTDEQIIKNCDYKFSSKSEFEDKNGIFEPNDYMKYPDYNIQLKQLATFTNSVFRLNGTTYKPITKRKKR